MGEWIENMAGCLGPRLLRLKGLVRPSGFADPVLINAVGGTFSPPRKIRADRDDGLGLMMILRDVPQAELFEVTGSATDPVLTF
ncbi:GTP-binding protein, partial [Acinetobacter pittii]|uniref:GTP-binding protein n=1 Tax=Acinetobacter pittii TaxID=48296 RepID=UPI0025A6199A